MLSVILLSLFSLTNAGLYLHTNGTQELLPVNNASVILPPVTEIRVADVLVNLATELAELRARVSTTGCAWQGIGCHCHYHENTLGTDSVAVVGSNCTNGSLYWVKIIDIITADVVFDCQAANTTLCSFYFD